jgi:hypothetical protein
MTSVSPTSATSSPTTSRPVAPIAGFPSVAPNRCIDDCNCMVCTDVTFNPDGTKIVCISSEACKDGTISWMCCLAASPSSQCNVEECIRGGEPDKSKCEEVDAFCMSVDENATSVTIQAHNGRFGSNDDVDNEVCGGNKIPGSGCGGTGVCTTDVDLTQCPSARPPNTGSPITAAPSPITAAPSSEPTTDQLEVSSLSVLNLAFDHLILLICWRRVVFQLLTVSQLMFPRGGKLLLVSCWSEGQFFLWTWRRIRLLLMAFLSTRQCA